MNTIVATIKPIHLGNIRRGNKTIEVRKTVPKCEYPIRVLLCESGSGGQIKAEFTLRRVIACPKSMFQRLTDEACSAAKCACLTVREVLDYLGDADTAYLWEVSDLIDYCSTKGCHILNISDFGLKRAPQSWQYVEEV